jgi:negative regulator of sigma E activity
MSGCSAVQARFSEYLDSQLTGREMQRIASHLEDCQACAREWSSLRHAQSSLAALGPVPVPEDLLLRIRVAVSREQARSRRSPFQGWGLAWKNTVGPFLLQATAGFASATLLMGTVIVLVTMFAAPEMAQATKDEPLGNATAPRLLYYLSSEVSQNEIDELSGPVVVEAYINGSGQVYDYRIVSGPTDEATRAQIENLMLQGVFEPARFFGKPVRGLAVLSFSGVSVRG